jgi:hypothetical protein
MATLTAESVLGMLPAALRWKLSQRLFLGVTACLRRAAS